MIPPQSVTAALHAGSTLFSKFGQVPGQRSASGAISATPPLPSPLHTLSPPPHCLPSWEANLVEALASFSAALVSGQGSLCFPLTLASSHLARIFARPCASFADSFRIVRSHFLHALSPCGNELLDEYARSESVKIEHQGYRRQATVAHWQVHGVGALGTVEYEHPVVVRMRRRATTAQRQQEREQHDGAEKG